MKLRASKLEIRDVENERDFLNNNHYQGYVPSSWCKGLYFNNELIMLMSFGKPRYTRKFDWELLRLCTKKDYIVYGGASRLLKHFKENNPGSIVSYCNRDRFNGSVYKALGFKSIRITKGYYYEKDGIQYHRSSFTRKRLEQLFPQYPRDKFTERQVMELEGYKFIENKIGQETFILADESAKYYIYEIENNGYHYIGQHLYRDDYKDDNYYGSGTIIKRLNKKYGNGIKTIIIDDIKSQELADKYERCAIYFNKLMYGDKNVNIQPGGHNYYVNRLKRQMSNETRELISKSRQEHSNIYKSSEFRAKMSQVTRGENNGMYGRNHTLESKMKMSETRKQRIKDGTIKPQGHKWTITDKINLSISLKQSEKKKQMMSSKEYKDNMSKAIKGLKWWNNGKEEIRSREQPDGFEPGRIKKPKLVDFQSYLLNQQVSDLLHC